MFRQLIFITGALGCALAGAVLERANNGEKIVGGQVAEKGQYPHQVSLRSTQHGHFCGGSIISNIWILTSTHCVRDLDPSTVQVLVGTNTLNSGGALYRVSEIIIHGLNNPTYNYYDVAALRLATPIVFTEFARPITLASTSEPPVGTECWLSGWGLTSYPSNKTSNSLQHIALTSINLKQCKKYLPFPYQFPVAGGHLCALAETGQGACVGDYGGALICGGIQHGIGSWGTIPCATGKPDVFTSVSFFREWIEIRTGV